MSQSDLGKMDVEWFSNLCFKRAWHLIITYLTGAVSIYGCVPPSWQINQVLFKLLNLFETPSTSCFSPGLVALLVDMTQVAAVGYGQ